MTRQGWAGHSRFDDHYDRHRADPPRTPDEDREEEPADVFYRRQVQQLRLLLEHDPPTDPALLERRRRDLAAAERRLAEATVADHWASGEGDRKLF